MCAARSRAGATRPPAMHPRPRAYANRRLATHLKKRTTVLFAGRTAELRRLCKGDVKLVGVSERPCGATWPGSRGGGHDGGFTHAGGPPDATWTPGTPGCRRPTRAQHRACPGVHGTGFARVSAM